MTWTRTDTAILAVAWIGLMAFVVFVCVLLPAPPERLASVVLDWFFGAVAVALAVGIVCVGLTVWFVRRSECRLADRLETLKRHLDGRTR
jgi:uncharacterized membrane protein YidH (DUF202 family)